MSKSVAVVVSRFNEDLAWIEDHCFDGLDASAFAPPVYYVYNKGAGALAPEVLGACGGGGRVVERRMANVGLESGRILEPILREYAAGNPASYLAKRLDDEGGEARHLAKAMAAGDAGAMAIFDETINFSDLMLSVFK